MQSVYDNIRNKEHFTVGPPQSLQLMGNTIDIKENIIIVCKRHWYFLITSIKFETLMWLRLIYDARPDTSGLVRLTQGSDGDASDEDGEAETIVAFTPRVDDDLCPGSYMPAGCLVMHICR